MADDNYLVREGAWRLLDAVQRLRPAAVFTDIRMPSARPDGQAKAGAQPSMEGRGNAGIAAQLYLSESSVEKHVNAIFTKLGLSAEQLSHRRVTAVLTFLRDAGLRG